jgi:hypothetical protein
MLDARAERVKACVTIIKLHNGQQERLTHGNLTRKIEELAEFDIQSALNLVLPKSEKLNGYAVFNHHNKTGYWLAGSFSDLLDSLEQRGLIGE